MKELIYINSIKTFCLSDDDKCKTGQSKPFGDMEFGDMPHENKAFKKNVILYGRRNCPYCEKAIAHLDNILNDKLIFVAVDDSAGTAFPKSKYFKEFNHNTVPMIVYKGKFVGGCDDAVKKPTTFWN